ncbi:Translin-1 [Microbotryomycetes sp. JL221]|nr:Translin-1 [Microbotryomycetes sp. JL221]
MATDSRVNFDYLKHTLEQDQQLRDLIRDAVKQLEQDLKQCMSVLQQCHQTRQSQTESILTQLTPLLPSINTSLSQLSQTIPETQFYKFHSIVASSLQQSSFVIVFSKFLSTLDVPTKDQVADQLGLNHQNPIKLILTTEDYLHSLISLLNELSRLAINRVTLGDFQAPLQYSKFAKELSTAFSILNLKNDSLRKRFDSIKYDVKKLEEIVYDLSLRGLLSTSTDTTSMRNVRDQNEQDENLIKQKKPKLDETA